MRWGLGVVVAVLLASVAPAWADDAVPGDTRATALPLTLGQTGSLETAAAHREDGDPADEGGHSVWFRFDPPNGAGTYSVDLAGTTFDSAVAFTAEDGSMDDDDLEPHPSVQFAGQISVPEQEYIRVDGVDAGAVGTARITFRNGAAPEDSRADPVPLELTGTAVAPADRTDASLALEPGEPGDGGEIQSVWWSFTAPSSGPLALDACLPPGLSTWDSAGVLRVLDDRPLGEATVLASGATRKDPLGCAPVTLDVQAGVGYRVQATYTPDYAGDTDDRAVVLRGVMAGTPPAVTAGYGACGTSGCPTIATVRTAPGTSATAVDCRVDGGAWMPCPARDDGTFTVGVGTGGGRHSYLVRATDSAGRTATFRGEVIDATPASAELGSAPPGGSGSGGGASGSGSGHAAEPPSHRGSGGGAGDDAGGGVLESSTPVASRPALPKPTGHFAKVEGGVRVRRLGVRGLPAGARVTVRCHGGGCPFARRRFVLAHGGSLGLATLLHGAVLRPGARLSVTVSAPHRASRGVIWRVRTRA